MALQEARNAVAALKAQVQLASQNDAALSEAVLLTKLALAKLPALPPLCRNSDTAAEELLIAREGLEWAAIASLKLSDTAGFERLCLQVQVYYTDFTHMPRSEGQSLITALHLMHLLAANRLGEFHAQLELLSEEDKAGDLIRVPVQLQELLVEGNYNKILKASRGTFPSPYFAAFVETLADTVREDVADCSEAAYEELTLDAAQSLLTMRSRAELQEFISARKSHWVVEGDRILFKRNDKPALAIPADELITNIVEYATNLERIV